MAHDLRHPRPRRGGHAHRRDHRHVRRPRRRAGTDRLLFKGRMPYTEALLRSTPEDGQPEPHPALAIDGRPPDLVNTPAGCAFAPRCPYAQDQCRAEKPPLVEAEPDHLYACWHPRDATAPARRRRPRDRHRTRPRPTCRRTPLLRSTTCTSRSAVRRHRCRPSPASASTYTRARRSGWWASRAAASPPPAGPSSRSIKPTSGTIRFGDPELTS